MNDLLALAADPSAWFALATLIVMEVVLGIDNLVFIAIVSQKLPEHQRSKARRIGIGLSLILRIALLFTISTIIRLTTPVISVLGQGFSWRDIILIAGGLFLVYKATSEIHQAVDPMEGGEEKIKPPTSFSSAIFQILLLDLVFSLDSIITAVGMTEHLPIMIIAVLTAVGAMLLAADPLANFIHRNPTIVMLALGFLLLIGATLIAEGFGFHFPKGYIYTAMAFSGLVEGLNMFARKRRSPKA
ncbi:Integral membrane protein TerC [Methylocella silvestris BL2]|uniref:Integral membrane protein TerC n=1 Tax=Methylocella silvestris (strain DSM 15510 / CIP 108128 / LMG 27833 / NCIMB 13906 / BL2) TaxID=395965 RepID=B8EQ15_METSB|nr:TerC family protein [Methylocella silvestris]ACK51505.1 Integral membrane protein TerC [Methylocella silvestris BL2]